MRNTRKRNRGGAATAFPLKYFSPMASEPEAASGHDLLKAIPPIGVRPRIGGKRRIHSSRRHILRKKRQNGGFIPSVMEGFVSAASNYITPIAIFAGYKFLTRKGTKGRRRHTRHKR